MRTVFPLLLTAALTLLACGPSQNAKDGGSAAPDAAFDLDAGEEQDAGVVPDAGAADAGPTIPDTDGGSYAPPPFDGGRGCQVFPPMTCTDNYTCRCLDGTMKEYGCLGPPTCADACCAYGGAPDAGT
jgi:hypothetical protein